MMIMMLMGKPAFWIQISGATLFAGSEIKQRRFGEYSDEVWDDIRDVEKIHTTIRDSPAREVERLLLSTSSSSSEGRIHTALLVAPIIYGVGNGPVNKRSIQAPDIARFVLRDGRGFRYLAGLNRWSTIHVGDLADVVGKLVRAAPSESPVSRELWNEQGIYLPATGIAVSLVDLLVGDLVAKNAFPFAEFRRLMQLDYARGPCSRLHQGLWYQPRH